MRALFILAIVLITSNAVSPLLAARLHVAEARYQYKRPSHQPENATTAGSHDLPENGQNPHSGRR